MRYILSLLACANVGFAATWFVEADGTGSTPSIQAAIVRAASGDSIELGPGTYAESLKIDRPLVLYGREGASETFLSGERTQQIALVTAGGPTTFKDLTFIQGHGDDAGSPPRAGGAVQVISTPVHFERCVFNDNASDDGAAVHVSTRFRTKPAFTTPASTVFAFCLFTENRAEGAGGAIYVGGNALSVTHCTFERNSAGTGGALYVRDTDFSISSSAFVANDSRQSGGAGCSRNLNLAEISQSRFLDNTAGKNGGAWCSEDAHPLVIRETTFLNNQAFQNGGGVYFLGALSATQSLWNGNRASGKGGGLTIGIQGAMVLESCTFINQVAALGASLATDASSNQIALSVFADPFSNALECQEPISGSCNLRSTDVIGGCLEFDETAFVFLCPDDATLFCDAPGIPACGFVGHSRTPCSSPGCGGTPTQHVSWGTLKRSFADP